MHFGTTGFRHHLEGRTALHLSSPAQHSPVLKPSPTPKPKSQTQASTRLSDTKVVGHRPHRGAFSPCSGLVLLCFAHLPVPQCPPAACPHLSNRKARPRALGCSRARSEASSSSLGEVEVPLLSSLLPRIRRGSTFPPAVPRPCPHVGWKQNANTSSAEAATQVRSHLSAAELVPKQVGVKRC